MVGIRQDSDYITDVNFAVIDRFEMNKESFGDSMEYNMRPSRVLRRMRAGNVATCVKINLSDLRDVEIACHVRF